MVREWFKYQKDVEEKETEEEEVRAEGETSDDGHQTVAWYPNHRKELDGTPVQMERDTEVEV